MPPTPVAVFESKITASNMSKPNSATPGYRAIPTAVFTIPDFVRAGMLEHEAEESGLDIDVRFNDTSGWLCNYRSGETVGATKILIDKSPERIIGARLPGHDYAELANTIALAMKNCLTTHQIKSRTAAFPSTGSDLGSLVYGFAANRVSRP